MRAEPPRLTHYFLVNRRILPNVREFALSSKCTGLTSLTRAFTLLEFLLQQLGPALAGCRCIYGSHCIFCGFWPSCTYMCLHFTHSCRPASGPGHAPTATRACASAHTCVRARIICLMRLLRTRKELRRCVLVLFVYACGRGDCITGPPLPSFKGKARSVKLVALFRSARACFFDGGG